MLGLDPEVVHEVQLQVTAGGFVTISERTGAEYVADVTDTAEERGVHGTPTVYVNGKETPATGADVTSAVNAAT